MSHLAGVTVKDLQLLAKTHCSCAGSLAYCDSCLAANELARRDVSDEPLTFARYNDAVFYESRIKYPDAGRNAVFPALGLMGEAGELAEKVKKLWRDQGTMSGANVCAEKRDEVAKEMGDVLWYLNAIASEFGLSLEQVAQMNIDKLRDREARRVIKGEGDNR
ncbi:MAG: putative MazG family pyrophosphatase [Acidobacteriales bacterium]|nr:putative MazG family pyrophosphatase [Terriglobales bacterium]